MANWGESKIVTSRDVELECRVETSNGRVPTEFSWTAIENGTLKHIHLVADPTRVPSGNRKYAYQKSPSVSVLVIKGVTKEDLNMYTCQAVILEETHSESVGLIQQGRFQKAELAHDHAYVGEIPTSGMTNFLYVPLTHVLLSPSFPIKL